MATVTCKVQNCPYLGGKPEDTVRFCRANTVEFMANGLCGNIFTPNGTPRQLDRVYYGIPQEEVNENN